MKKKSVKKTAGESDFESLVVSIVQIHQQAQEFATKASHYSTYPIRETVPPELLTQVGAPLFQPPSHVAPMPKWESVTAKSQKVETASPQFQPMESLSR